MLNAIRNSSVSTAWSWRPDISEAAVSMIVAVRQQGARRHNAAGIVSSISTASLISSMRPHEDVHRLLASRDEIDGHLLAEIYTPHFARAPVLLSMLEWPWRRLDASLWRS